MGLEFTAVFRKVPEGYIGFVEELPGANTQGATLEEARANLQEAVELVLQRGLPSRMEPDASRVNVPTAGAGDEPGSEPLRPREQAPEEGSGNGL